MPASCHLHIIASCACAALVHAQGPAAAPPFPAPAHPAGIGVAALFGQSPYVGVDDRFLAIPALRYRGERLELEGPRASYAFVARGPLRAAAVVRWDFSGFDTDESPVFAGLEKRRDSLLAGARGTVPIGGGFRLSGELLTDTLSRHEGQLGHLGLARPFRLRENTLVITPTVEVESMSSDYAGYYFGVPEEQARSDRPAHRPGTTFNTQAGVQTLWLFRERWSALLGVRATRLSDDIVESPLVNDRVGISLLTAVSWAF